MLKVSAADVPEETNRSDWMTLIDPHQPGSALILRGKAKMSDNIVTFLLVNIQRSTLILNLIVPSVGKMKDTRLKLTLTLLRPHLIVVGFSIHP